MTMKSLNQSKISVHSAQTFNVKQSINAFSTSFGLLVYFNNVFHHYTVGCLVSLNLVGCAIYTNVTEIPRGILADAKLVKILNSKLSIIPADAFSHLDACVELDIQGNDIDVIEGGAFRGMDGLLDLKILDNKISTVKTGAFDEMAEVRKFRLKGNNIDTIQTSAFRGLSNMQVLQVYSNTITRVETRAFSWSNSSTAFTISNNTVHYLEPDAFRAPSTYTVSGMFIILQIN